MDPATLNLQLWHEDTHLCIASPYNRRILRRARWDWADSFEDETIPPGYWRPIPTPHSLAHIESSWEPGTLALPEDPDAATTEMRVRAYLEDNSADAPLDGEFLTFSNLPEALRPPKYAGFISFLSASYPAIAVHDPGRCTYATQFGKRCVGYALPSLDQCRLHALSAVGDAPHTKMITQLWDRFFISIDPRITQAAASSRLHAASPKAADVLEEVMRESPNDALRLKAATEILDRAGMKGASGVEVNIINTGQDEQARSAVALIAERLDRLAQGATAGAEDDETAIEDAELVTATPELPPPPI